MSHHRLVPALMCASLLVVLRTAEPATRIGIETAHLLARALALALLAAALTTAWRATRGLRPRERRHRVRFIAVFAAFLTTALALSGGIRFGAGPGTLSTGHAFGPFTAWPSLSFTLPLLPVSGFFTFGRLALLGTSALLVALAVHLVVEARSRSAHCRRGWGALGLGGLGTTGCPTCSLIPLMVGGGTTAGAVLAWNPGSALAAALDALAIVGPLAVVLALTRAPSRQESDKTLWARTREWRTPALVALPAVFAVLGMPDGDSSRQQAIHGFYVVTLVVGTLLTLLAVGLLVGFAVHYRDKGRDPRDHEMAKGMRRMVQGAYIVVPVLVIFGLGIFSYVLLVDMENAPEPDQRIDVVANRFAWHFTYPDGTTSTNELRVRSGDAIFLNISSPDVIHSLFIPDMGVKIDATPGVVTHAWFEPTGEGSYPAYCVEYCGVGHASMRANLLVYPADGPQPGGDTGRGPP